MKPISFSVTTFFFDKIKNISRDQDRVKHAQDSRDHLLDQYENVLRLKCIAFHITEELVLQIIFMFIPCQQNDASLSPFIYLLRR